MAIRAVNPTPGPPRWTALRSGAAAFLDRLPARLLADEDVRRSAGLFAATLGLTGAAGTRAGGGSIVEALAELEELAADLRDARVEAEGIRRRPRDPGPIAWHRREVRLADLTRAVARLAEDDRGSAPSAPRTAPRPWPPLPRRLAVPA